MLGLDVVLVVPPPPTASGSPSPIGSAAPRRPTSVTPVGVRLRAEVDERPIGVFDSGLGGLTVLRALVDLLPARVHALLR